MKDRQERTGELSHCSGSEKAADTRGEGDVDDPARPAAAGPEVPASVPDRTLHRGFLLLGDPAGRRARRRGPCGAGGTRPGAGCLHPGIGVYGDAVSQRPGVRGCDGGDRGDSRVRSEEAVGVVIVPPPGTSPLSPLPSPSHRPGEGDFAEAVAPIGCVSTSLPILKTLPTTPIASTAFPSPGRWEGDGRGDRGEISGGGRKRILKSREWHATRALAEHLRTSAGA